MISVTLPMGVEIRKLAAGDAAALAAFADAFDDALDAGATEAFLADPRHHLLVGYADGLPAGFLSATELLHPDKPRSELFLNEIAVVEAHRRRGVASALIAALRRLVDELGCRGFYVLTEPDNVAANALYRATGGRMQEVPNVMYWYDAGLDVTREDG